MNKRTYLGYVATLYLKIILISRATILRRDGQSEVRGSNATREHILLGPRSLVANCVVPVAKESLPQTENEMPGLC